MTTTAAELKDEYRARLCACQQPVSQNDTDWEWLHYLKRLHEEAGDLRVFGLYMKRAREVGLALIFRFVREEITAAELVARTKVETSADYVGVLRSAGLVGDLPQPQYDEMVAELDLEMLKAYTPLAGLDPALTSTCEAVAVAASTIWFRFVEQFHAILGLPSVARLRHVVVTLSDLEHSVLEGNDFSAYAMADIEERKKYQAILEAKTPA